LNARQILEETKAEPNAKAVKILDAARAAFLELGFEGASVDDIARRAQVSKPTVYSYFGDKAAVFTAVIKRECEDQATRIFAHTPEEGEVENLLLAIATDYIRFLLSPSTQSIFRVAIGESQRFPELSQAFYDSGPGIGAARLAVFLKANIERGVLAIDDIRLAAHQFTELCRADIFYRRLLRGDEIKEDEISRAAKGAVDLFLRGYRADAPVSKPRLALFGKAGRED